MKLIETLGTNKMSTPKKHHYVPQFYLEGFTNSEGKYWVYDKKTDKIFPSSPPNSFFEKFRNTVYRDTDKENTEIETLYSQMEGEFAQSIKGLRNHPQNQDLEPDELIGALLFASNLQWRVPSMDEKHREILKNKSILDLGFQITHKETGESIPKELIEGIEQEEQMELFLKISNSLLPFLGEKLKEDWGNWRLHYFSHPVHITSDNPVVTMNSDPFEDITRELILPISSQRVLVNTKNGSRDDILPFEAIKVDICVAKNAKRFFCGPDKRIIEMLRMVLKQSPQFGEYWDGFISETFKIFDRKR